MSTTVADMDAQFTYNYYITAVIHGTIWQQKTMGDFTFWLRLSL